MAARYAGPAIILSRHAQRMVRGINQVQTLAQTVVAEGGELIAIEQRVYNGTQVIGRFKSDLLVQLQNKVITLIESKGVPWHLFGTSGWDSYIGQLQRQASAFGQTTTSAGVQIQQRIIVFASRAPEGLEMAENQLRVAIGRNYQEVIWGIHQFEQYLADIK